jgi:hypothetical protein
MSIGSFSAGILPTGTGFAPAPAPPIPVMPAPTMSGLAVNTNGSLVSMLPPVTDWFSPVAQVPTVQTPTTAHPCQSGGDCGCGGACGAKKSTNPQTNNTTKNGSTPINPEIKAKLATIATDVKKQLGKEGWENQILRTTPGSSTVTTAVTPAGDYLSSVATVDQLRNINLKVKDLKSDRTIINIQLQWIGTGWNASNANTDATAIVPTSVSLDGLATIALATAIAARNTEIQAASTSSSDLCSQVQIQPSGQSDCIVHDLVCTPFSGQDWPFSSDHKHIEFWAPCVGSYQADISGCCFNHDIACWCSHNQGDIALANFNVINCIIESIIAGAYTALAQADLFFLAAAFCATLIFAWQATLLTFSVLGVPVVGALYVLFNVFYDATLTWLTDAPCYFNFDHSHDNSCLCGGTMPTTQCQGLVGNNYGPCVDICKLAGDSGNETGCFNCGWVCDTTQNPPVPVWTPTAPSGQTCCPGTQEECISESAAPIPTCCYNCWWNCLEGDDNDTLYFECDGNLPCCDPDLINNPPYLGCYTTSYIVDC